MSKKVLITVWLFISTIIVLTNVSYGYLDPSAMTYVIQIVAAIGIATATSVGIFFYKIKRFFTKKKEKKVSEPEDN